MIKFLIDYGIGELRGDRVAARECYIAILEMDDHLQTMNVEKQWTVVELVEKLEEILLCDSRLDRTTKVDTLASPHVRQALTTFLRENQDVFAWNHEDMPGIDRLVMVHRLNVSSDLPPIS